MGLMNFTFVVVETVVVVVIQYDEQKAFSKVVAMGANVTKVVKMVVVMEEDGLCARDSGGGGGNSTVTNDRVSGFHKANTA